MSMVMDSDRSAIISTCNQYRYRLERKVQDDGIIFAYFGINPSTADALIDDATVRKWIGFTKVNHGRRFIVGNVFAFRSTDVDKLAVASDPIGEENDKHIDSIIQDADVLVPCWGNLSKVPRSLQYRLDDVLNKLVNSGKPVMTFGLTKGGDPKHPLMLGYATNLVDWRSND